MRHKLVTACLLISVLAGGIITGQTPSHQRGAIPSFAAPPVPTKPTPPLRPRGAKASPRHKLAGTPRHLTLASLPVTFLTVPSQLSYWGNQTYGDCVTAEECAAKAVYSVSLGLPEVFVTEQTAIAWATSHGFLNGADLTSVMDAMIADGITASDGKVYKDGPYNAVDWTNDANLCSAIASGPVKLGVAANQLDSIVGTSNGWIATGFRSDQNMDHNVGVVGYGTWATLCPILGVPVPPKVTPTARAYAVFTWDTVGLMDESSLIAISSEAWVRNPTTPGQSPIPVPDPTPIPAPTPTPVPTPTPAPAPSPSTMLYLGYDQVNKTVMVPSGWTARTGIYPSQINLHLGANFVAIPSGWTAIQSIPITGTETMP